MVVFWTDGVMRIREFVKPLPPAKDFFRNPSNYSLWREDDERYNAALIKYNESLNASIDNSLPVADESKEKVKWLIYRLNHEAWEEKEWRNSNWQPDLTKEYTIEAECRKDYAHSEECRIECRCTVDDKVLVLVE